MIYVNNNLRLVFVLVLCVRKTSPKLHVCSSLWCGHNGVQYVKILHNTVNTATEHKSNFELTKDTHTSPSWERYWVSIVRIVEEIDRVIATSHCTLLKFVVVWYRSTLPIILSVSLGHCAKRSYKPLWRIWVNRSMECTHPSYLYNISKENTTS